MAISFVQKSSIAGNNGATGDSFTLTLTGVTGGNAIIVCSSISAAPATGGHVTSVNDGNAYTNAVQSAQVYGGSSYNVASIDFLLAAASGSHSIVVTNNAGSFNTYGFGWACEVSGLAISPLDKTQTNANASGNTPSTGSTGTLALANEIAFAVFNTSDAGNSSLTLPSGFTNIGSIQLAATYTASQGSADYAIVSATTALNANWGAGLSGTPSWSACIATFAAASSKKLLLLSS
jgi:hypothetical protein